MTSSSARQRALAIIKDEHRSLSAILHGMLYLVRVARESGAKLDFAVLRAMVYYIDSFSERFHHPKEDAYLYHLLRQRTTEAEALLHEVEMQHAEGGKLIRDLEQSLLRYEQGGLPRFEEFAQVVQAYAEFHWNHMRLEEDELMPLAQKHLTPQDWEKIAQAFGENGDPLFGIERDEEFRALFSRIVQLAPAPLGVGSPLN